MDEESDRFLYPSETFEKTPSLQDGISPHQELLYRQKLAMLMQVIGTKSALSQLAVNTSVIYMHRFFMYRSVKKFARVHLAVAFVFSAGKVEESARKLEHLIRTTIDIIRQKKEQYFLDKSDELTYRIDCESRQKIETLIHNGCNLESAAYLDMRKIILEYEIEIYSTIGFHLQVVHPHNFVIRMCAMLGAENIKDISQFAYNLATASSQLTMMCLKYKPHMIATVCLNIASVAHSIRFVNMKDKDIDWYQVHEPTTEWSTIEAMTEEFMEVIKNCSLLPTWMSNLARGARSNSRPMAGPSRAPGSSSASAPIASSRPSGSVASSQQQPAISSGPQRATGQPSAQSSQSSDAGVLHNSSSHLPSQTGADHVPSSQAHSGQHARTHGPPSSSSGVRQPHSSSSSHPQQSQQHHHSQHHQQQHRSQANSNNGNAHLSRQIPNTGVSAQATSNRPQPRLPSSGHSSSNGRPSSQHHPGQPPHHSSSQQMPQLARSQDPAMRPKGSQDVHKSTSDLKRPHDQSRVPYNQTRPDHRRSDGALHARHLQSQARPGEDLNLDRSRSQQNLQPSTGSRSPHTPPTAPPVSPPTIKSQTSPAVRPPSPPHPILEAAGTSVSQAGDAPMSISPDDNKKQPQGSKISLASYRDRARSKAVPVQDQGLAPAKESIITTLGQAVDARSAELSDRSATNSPAELPRMLKQQHGADNSSPLTLNDSSSARAKIKLKVDPATGERHAVKFTDSGLKIKIKPIRSDTAPGNIPIDIAGTSSGIGSRSSTPCEEGEIVETSTPPLHTPPGSSSHRKEGGLRMRIPLLKSGESGPDNRSREHSNPGSDRDSNSSSSSHHIHSKKHHHGSSHGHHSHKGHSGHKKSKHSSKHSSSRHERGSSSKRPLDHSDERPSKSSRLDGHSSHHHHSSASATMRLSEAQRLGYSSSQALQPPPIPSVNLIAGRSSLQHQNSGFSINDAFTATMPNNIFDDSDDEDSVVTPTIAPSNPPHHERFHQLMAQHRATVSKNPPLPPLPNLRGPPPPPPPPPPASPPPPPGF